MELLNKFDTKSNTNIKLLRPKSITIIQTIHRANIGLWLIPSPFNNEGSISIILIFSKPFKNIKAV